MKCVCVSVSVRWAYRELGELTFPLFAFHNPNIVLMVASVIDNNNDN